MSDSWLILVPADPEYLPDTAIHDAAIELFRRIAPGADDIEVILTDRIQFFDCGAHFERVVCPGCRAEVSIDWWQARMNEDFDGEGFNLGKHTTPCCGSEFTLNELQYESPQAFARFGISAMNPGLFELTVEQMRKFEQLFQTPLRTVYQHL